MNLPISENKLQQLITDAKDFVYGLGKATEGILFDCVEMMLNATDAFVNDYIFFHTVDSVHNLSQNMCKWLHGKLIAA